MTDPVPTDNPEDLLRRIALLEQRVARKSDAQQQSYAEFQALIYTISHDFRAPLRAILSSCMILKEDYGDGWDPEARAELDRQVSNVKKLNGLLEALLTVSRLANYEFAPTHVKLAAIARGAAAEVGTAALDALELDTDAVVKADPTLLQLALSQLFENSVKFADPDRPLKITVSVEGDVVRVSDNGTGFDPSNADKIFLPFERLNRDDQPGSGMGLTKFKRIVDRHGGAVGFESVPGEGAVFWFTLSDR